MIVVRRVAARCCCCSLSPSFEGVRTCNSEDGPRIDTSKPPLVRATSGVRDRMVRTVTRVTVTHVGDADPDGVGDMVTWPR